VRRSREPRSQVVTALGFEARWRSHLNQRARLYQRPGLGWTCAEHLRPREHHDGVIEIALLAVKLYAFVTSLRYRDEAYRAAGKLTKPAWTIILGLGVLAQVALAGSPLNLVNLALTVAALVYLADVRPALASLTRR